MKTILTTVACLLALAACAGTEERETTGEVEVEPTIDMDAPTDTLNPAVAPAMEWHSILSGRTKPDAKGEVVLRDAAEAGAWAAIELENGEAGATYPWHVHVGDCDSDGAIVGLASEYPPLQVGPDGEATAEANISVELTADGDYYVNVHKSAAELQTIVACGEVEES